MERNEFLRLQYAALREEIKETKARIFRTLGFGIVVVPAANVVAQSYHIDSLILSMPLLVMVTALIYLSENNAKMRCGRFIRIHIESSFKGTPCWETWLEYPGDNYPTRDVDKYLDYCFYILFFVYFVGSVFLATRFSFQNHDLLIAVLYLSFHVAIGLWFVIYLIAHIQVSTKTREEIAAQRRKS